MFTLCSLVHFLFRCCSPCVHVVFTFCSMFAHCLLTLCSRLVRSCSQALALLTLSSRAGVGPLDHRGHLSICPLGHFPMRSEQVHEFTTSGQLPGLPSRVDGRVGRELRGSRGPSEVFRSGMGVPVSDSDIVLALCWYCVATPWVRHRRCTRSTWKLVLRLYWSQ